ncbi:MAG TPA: proline--tRNA ligase [Candidatus Hydrogenedentes bacterium]|nr:proline--tRNA ligase [Candidatus Hydrogenedentota bacterium]HPC16574.1 proline--tRNA ligase [Candidatus Hydrogenedentota bacterium]HRT18927.1 proline--tRNA ligase [Candidatus Hydrogenedentota bacterium]HRT64961.1 proline--tRNA ligase [Candidatus Hydrogenedentota bacterium]
MAKNITKRGDDYSQWYIDVVLQGELADYAPVKGCMVIKPNGYAVWENIQKNLDRMFKETGHVNAYFPVFIPESFLKKEAEHVEGFAPECAVVTHAGGKPLEEPLVIRPTSETIIWSMYRNWISSYRDLPLLINQWANVCRWEMRTRLFLRTTEFLWQEGHTAHATHEEAEEEAYKMVHVYKRFAEEYMAMPVIAGRKTDSEKFAGALHTYCIEAMMQDGKALQAGTSHHLGQNFAKAFDVQFQDANKQLQYVFATSWGVSTRLIGGMVMTHSDDNGLVIPPKLAPLPVVFVPIWRSEEEMARVLGRARELTRDWDPLFYKIDDRDQYKPGFKFAEWEVRGVPIRIEIGPRDCDNNQVVAVRRDTGAKIPLPMDGLQEKVCALLDEIQANLFNAAKRRMDERTYTCDSYSDYKNNVGDGGFFRVHWCGGAECEALMSEETKSTIRCIPFDAEEENGVCMICGKPSNRRVVASQSY